MRKNFSTFIAFGLVFVMLLSWNPFETEAKAEIQMLEVPQNIELNDEGIASWDLVPNAKLYGLYAGVHENGEAKYAYCILLDNYETKNGRAIADISSWLNVACDRLGYKSGKVKMSIKLYSYSADSTKWKDSAQSAPSNEIEFTINQIANLGVPQNIELSDEGIASWDLVPNAKLYGLYAGVHENGEAKYAYCILLDNYETKNGRAIADISSWLNVACDRLGYKSGKVKMSIKLYSYSADSTKWNDSAQSVPSNEIEFDLDILSYEEYEKQILPGDINTDGLVDGRDVIHLMKYLAGETDAMTDKLIKIHEDNADVDGNGSIDEKDLLRLIKYLGGEKVVLEYGNMSGNG